MAADSGSFRDGRIYPALVPKIVRCPDGRIAGCAGPLTDIQRFNDWFSAGGDAGNKPTMAETDKASCIDILMATPDGRCWRGDERLDFYEVGNPYAIGELTSATFADAAMLGGMGAKVAVAFAIKHCVWVGGDVQSAQLLSIAAAA